MTTFSCSCSECGEPLRDGEQKCSKCGSGNKSVVIGEAINVREGMKGKHRAPGVKKPLYEFKIGWDWNKKKKEFRWVRQVVDRVLKKVSKTCDRIGWENS